MSLGRSTALSDTGRKRRRNEDAYVCQPPLFAVADGMGGAQAGEVASRLAAGAVESTGGNGSGEERVAGLIQEANRRVFQHSSEDEAKRGMGTTMTAALVEDNRVAIGHVGDSRAYIVRGGKLEQLTDDHSLVAELVRSGKLSPEEAETHPQRSVITRVLGTEAQVDVDTFSVETEAGDLFMLCSDGLSSMVDDETILAVVERHRSDLDAVARALVNAANREGGEDNITVVLFEIAAAVDETAKLPVPAEAAAEEQASPGEEDTLSGIEGVPTVDLGSTGVQAPLLEHPGHDDWEAEGAPPPLPPKRKRRRRRRLLAWTVLAACVVALCGVLLWGLSRTHFVGAESDGHVAVYQGLPYDITSSVRLYRPVYTSPVLVAQLSQAERRSLFDHTLRSYDSARSRVRVFEEEVSPESP